MFALQGEFNFFQKTFFLLIRILFLKMKKIDILNFITSYRQNPGGTKTYQELLDHLGSQNETLINQMLAELKGLKVVKEVEVNGQRAYQVDKK